MHPDPVRSGAILSKVSIHNPLRISRQTRTSAHFVLTGISAAAIAMTFVVCFLSGCASNMTQAPPPIPSAKTEVTVMLTSTANDRLTQFDIEISSVSLTSRSGNTVMLFQNENPPIAAVNTNAEFMHLNGAAEPLASASIPQDIYTAATVHISGCDFTNVTPNSSGSITAATYAEGLCGQGTGNTTVNMPFPIVIGGSRVNVALDLQVSQSYTLDTSTTPATYTISPVFTLTSAPISAPTGEISSMEAQVSSVRDDGSSLVVQTAEGGSLTLKTNGSTTYQGISGFSALMIGVFLNMDLAFQADDSLLATRIQAEDLSSALLNAGPGEQGPYALNGKLTFVNRPLLALGCAAASIPGCFNSVFEYTTAPAFTVSGQFMNQLNLPFTARFDSTSIFPGQNVAVFFPVTNQQTPVVNSFLLLPQTIRNRNVTFQQQRFCCVHCGAGIL